VVSGGLVMAAAGMSSKPTSATSAGTRSPAAPARACADGDQVRSGEDRVKAAPLDQRLRRRPKPRW
jgi:hypothetical protein